MARIARDSTPKRRSTRLSNNQQSAKKMTASNLQLESVSERDETPEAHTPTDKSITTPNANSNVRLSRLSTVTTPKTEPKPDQDQMHPATVHPTTAKAPDSGLKLGFADISTTGQASLASLQNTPSRPRQSLATTNISPSFQFNFSHKSNMSDQGRKMMDSIKTDAARIKAQMRAENETHTGEETKVRNTFIDAAGRRIATPMAKSGRFSDVHMAQFKKMDSIANHPSSFRARPGFARPTAQSLKRTSSKANLDEPERPKTAGKSPSIRVPPPISGRPASVSPFKSIPQSPSTSDAPTKRLRLEGDDDVSSSKHTELPQSVSSRLLSPTKASAARATTCTSSPLKSPGLPPSHSVRARQSVSRPSTAVRNSPSKIPQGRLNKPLPPTPGQQPRQATVVATKQTCSPIKEAITSRVPTAIAGLKSILRSPRKLAEEPTPKHAISNIPVPASAQKKVDFTPSVKSRYAVKLAEGSPSPAKLDRANPTSDKWEPAIPYDSSAFVVDNSPNWASDNEDEVQVVYPSLPSLDPRPTSQAGPVDNTFSRYAREHNKRESAQFKSIFTACNPGAAKSASLTSVNTKVNRTNPIVHASQVASASTSAASSPRKSTGSPTVRHVRASEPSTAPQIQLFQDLLIPAIPHGLPGKKRRMESDVLAHRRQEDEAKENRPSNHNIPGGWNDSTLPESDDEGTKRGGKRARFTTEEDTLLVNRTSSSPIKKPSAAREAAVKSAKDRKAKASIGGKITSSRLNALAQPKKR